MSRIVEPPFLCTCRSTMMAQRSRSPLLQLERVKVAARFGEVTRPSPDAHGIMSDESPAVQ